MFQFQNLLGDFRRNKTRSGTFEIETIGGGNVRKERNNRRRKRILILAKIQAETGEMRDRPNHLLYAPLRGVLILAKIG